MPQHSINFGNTLKQEGMKRSLATAERVNPGWQQAAYSFLCEFVKKSKGEFLAEDIRVAAEGVIPTAPHGRAWGGIISKAAYWKVIRRVGFRKVKNPTAHNAMASVWIAV